MSKESKLEMQRIARQEARRAANAATETREYCNNDMTTGVGIGTSGYILRPFNGLSQGDTASNRDGDQIRQIRLNCTGYFEAESADVTNLMRVMLVRCKASVTTANFPHVYGCVTQQHKNMYDVIYDKIHYLACSTDPIAGGASVNQTKYPIQWSFNLHGAKAHYPPGSDLPDDVGTYILYFVSDSVAVSHPDVVLEVAGTFKP